MDTIAWWVRGVALLVALCGPAQAKDDEMYKLYGGTYSPDCRNGAAPLVRVDAKTEALMLEHAGKRMLGQKLQPAYSYFGRSPPPGYEVALMSDTRGGQLLFIVYRDKRGLYGKLDGDAKVVAAIGKPLLAPTYRRCP